MSKDKEQTVKKLVIVDDHELFRLTLSAIIYEIPNVVIIRQYDGVADCVANVEKDNADIYLIDLFNNDENGLEAGPVIKAKNSQATLLLVTMHKEENLLEKAAEYGFDFVIFKDYTKQQIVDSIQQFTSK